MTAQDDDARSAMGSLKGVRMVIGCRMPAMNDSRLMPLSQRGRLPGRDIRTFVDAAARQQVDAMRQASAAAPMIYRQP